MSNFILTVFDQDQPDEQVIRIHIGQIEPRTAAMTVLKALGDYHPPVPKKTRSDAGKPRKKPAEQPPTPQP